jgi:hypothetical protein
MVAVLELLQAQSRVRQAMMAVGAGGAALYAYRRFTHSKQAQKEEDELKKR